VSTDYSLEGKSVLVTGGTGAFGRAFVQSALDCDARRVVVFSRDEAKQAAMRLTLVDPRMRYFLGDVRDEDRLLRAFRGVDIVVHAAAMKRIDSCEEDPTEAIETNILGSQRVAMAAIASNVETAVLLSTDKASSACTLYGMTKAVAEREWIQSNAYADGTHTRLVATRYGNVLGSTGSVVPIWQAAWAAGQPAIVTHPDATRFWMSMGNAVNLVHLAIHTAQRGEIFVPNMHASSLRTLLEACYPLHLMVDGIPSSAWVSRDCLRAGEKMHETLISEDESYRTTVSVREGVYIIQPSHPTWSYAPRGQTLAPMFSVRSDTAPQHTVQNLRRLLTPVATP